MDLSSLNLIDLDFDSLKNSFKNYLRTQDQFKDYDFEGSNINVLLDLLAYNTTKNAFFLNMAISESFLDSAQLRDSVASIAKELNYLPRSRRSAKAQLEVNFEATGDNQPYTISKGSTFNTQLKNQSFVFSVPETLVCSSTNTSFTFTTDVYEGIYLKDVYVFIATEDLQRFRISNKEVDTSSVTVTVYEDNNQVGVRYNYATTLLDLNETSKVFFMQSAENGYYEVLFGDNVIGKRPKVNSRIVIDYRISNAELANGAKDFTINFDPTGASELSTTPDIVTITQASGGRTQETNDSVRYYAPRHFQVQERTVVPSDYEVALQTQFPEINAVSVYGGEELDPPRFGKVFIAVDIENIEGIPDSKKREYYSFIKSRNPLSIEPVFVNPDFTYLAITSAVKYNINVTDSSFDRIKTLVTDAITTYNTEVLDDFKVTLRYSKLTAAIDNSDESIVSNETDIQVYKKLSPRLGRAQNLVTSFAMELSQEFPSQDDRHPATNRTTISSSSFVYYGVNAFLEDDGLGKIRIVRADGANYIKITDVGTVNYETGDINIANFRIESFDGAYLKIYARPAHKDISSDLNTILTLEADEIHLTVEALRL